MNHKLEDQDLRIQMIVRKILSKYLCHLPVPFLQSRRILSTHFYNQSPPSESLGQIVLLVFFVPPASLNLCFLSASEQLHMYHISVCATAAIYGVCR